MFYRIVGFSLLGCLILAFVLNFAGITQVGLGNGLTNWLRFVNTKYQGWSIEIPDIPKIPLLAKTSSSGTDLDFDGNGSVTLGEFFGWLFSNSESWIQKIFNAIIYFFNIVITLLNILVRVLNIVIQVIQFVLTMVYCVTQFKDYLSNDLWHSDLNIDYIQPFVI